MMVSTLPPVHATATSSAANTHSHTHTHVDLQLLIAGAKHTDCNNEVPFSCASSTASTASSDTAASKASVSFSTSTPTVHHYEKDFLPEDKPLLWYSKADIQAMTAAEKLCVQQYIRENPCYVTHLLKIWSTPCMQEEVLASLVKPIHDASIRGLEKHCLRAMKARRGVVLRKVFQAQWGLQSYIQDPQERALMLKEECQPLSRTSARFARALALGDEQAALQ